MIYVIQTALELGFDVRTDSHGPVFKLPDSGCCRFDRQTADLYWEQLCR